MVQQDLDITIKYASLSDIDGVKKIADKNSGEKLLGFVLRPALIENAKKKHLIVAKIGDEVIGFVNFNVRKKDKVTVVYEICTRVDFRKKGVATRMLKALSLPIELKCVRENKTGCDFYSRFGFVKIGTFKGKKNILNVYRYE